MANEFEGIKSAADTAKQIITLCTGVITLTVTFLDKLGLRSEQDEIVVPIALKASWVCYGIALAAGLITLMALTGVANKAALNNAIPDAMSGNIRMFGGLMVAAFFLAVALTIATGFVLFG